MTRQLAAVASGRADPDLAIKGAQVLSTYSERMSPDREIWLTGGRIAAVKPAGAYKGSAAKVYDARGGIVAPGGASIDCTVRNLSATGAALEVVSPLYIPGRFKLIVQTDNLNRPCHVVWRKERRIGVAFD
jgi:hypothetical protein